MDEIQNKQSDILLYLNKFKGIIQSSSVNEDELRKLASNIIVNINLMQAKINNFVDRGYYTKFLHSYSDKIKFIVTTSYIMLTPWRENLSESYSKYFRANVFLEPRDPPQDVLTTLGIVKEVSAQPSTADVISSSDALTHRALEAPLPTSPTEYIWLFNPDDGDEKQTYAKFTIKLDTDGKQFNIIGSFKFNKKIEPFFRMLESQSKRKNFQFVFMDELLNLLKIRK